MESSTQSAKTTRGFFDSRGPTRGPSRNTKQFTIHCHQESYAIYCLQYTFSTDSLTRRDNYGNCPYSSKEFRTAESGMQLIVLFQFYHTNISVSKM